MENIRFGGNTRHRFIILNKVVLATIHVAMTK